MFQKVTTVAFYDTLGSDAMRFMCNQTELTTVAMSEEMVGKFAKLKLQDAESEEVKMHRVKNLVVFEDEVSNDNKEMAEKADLKIYHFNALIAKGAALKQAGTAPAVQEPAKEDVYMFSYTSGTTGDPKGVQLSHQMILGTSYSVQNRIKSKMTEDDCYVSYLPASHSFE